MPNPLGKCEKCKADLCVTGRMIVCTKCGLPHAQHAMQLLNDAERKRIPSDVVVQPQDVIGTDRDRLYAAEKQVVAIQEQSKATAKRMDALESLVQTLKEDAETQPDPKAAWSDGKGKELAKAKR